MEAGKKSCPYCAEVIMAEAILCKHCQSELRPKTPIPSGWPIGLVGKIVVGTAVAITLYLAFGFYLSNTSESEELRQAREAAERCREQVTSYSGPALGKSLIAETCRKVEDEFRKSLSHAP